MEKSDFKAETSVKKIFLTSCFMTSVIGIIFLCQAFAYAGANPCDFIHSPTCENTTKSRFENSVVNVIIIPGFCTFTFAVFTSVFLLSLKDRSKVLNELSTKKNSKRKVNN
jgi:multisubunit Na+/H+ antiporter MnhB subunit